MDKLHRSSSDRIIAGVCGGLAEYLGISSSTVRLIAVILFMFGGLSLWVYVIAAILLPLE
ncbi:phage shock protein PspC (stress-responsive transcriptional regulator) [Peptoniphilus koenoeneniae]|uniref:Phage shock protein PspC (Stress-responsive transcriptional regulator) n=1 Tax=Peptoniphilus koenoeneniae TaxID=507751 RepID=A0ABU0AVF3_9FIRM|nr:MULTISPECIES: PspC domain-containing protein [Peptoniphilus]ERT58123.1 PspC domain protein [Peptoniphilus sp. BV3C26]MDQ0274819.1 phage shock protein PspC (stress-responsive transcriptional regulator) [Peptoniphilus koenoeneniae]